MDWEHTLSTIREGNHALEFGENGLPKLACNAGVFEILELLSAVSEGYMRNLNKLRSLRNYVKREMKNIK